MSLFVGKLNFCLNNICAVTILKQLETIASMYIRTHDNMWDISCLLGYSPKRGLSLLKVYNGVCLTAVLDVTKCHFCPFFSCKIKTLSTVLCEVYCVLVNAQAWYKRKNKYTCWCFRMVLGFLSRYQVHKANRFQAKRRERPNCMWIPGVSDSPCGCCWLSGVEFLVF